MEFRVESHSVPLSIWSPYSVTTNHSSLSSCCMSNFSRHLQFLKILLKTLIGSIRIGVFCYYYLVLTKGFFVCTNAAKNSFISGCAKFTGLTGSKTILLPCFVVAQYNVLCNIKLHIIEKMC
jgi:hypothetical protein